jgi:Na+-driven multidrug efflux pump
VTVLGMGVAGVGLATIASQYLTAILVTVHLTRTDTAIRLKINKLHLNKPALLEMLRIGLPAGFQNALFSISNVIIQSNVNSFGSAAMAGISAGSNFDSYIYTVTNGFSQAAMTFTSQNIGAKKKENLSKIFRICFITASIAAVILSCAGFIFRESIVGLFSKDPEVIRLGAERMSQIMPFYTFCSLLDVTNGSIRGFGHSFDVMLISLAGTCGLRLLWVFFVLPLDRTLRMLYWAYPISWFATLAAAFILYMVLLRKYANNNKNLPEL